MEHLDKIMGYELDTLGFYLHRALSAMIKNLNRQFKEHNINLQHAQYIILYILWKTDGLSQAELARILGKNPAAISRAISYLEERGYVERKDKNGTTNNVFLTPYANSRRSEIIHVAVVVTQQALSSLHYGDYHSLADTLTEIYENSNKSW